MKRSTPAPASSASSSSRTGKLLKLNETRRRVAHVSAKAMSELLKEVEEHGLPELSGRKNIMEAAKTELAQHNSYGPLLKHVPAKLKSGGATKVLIVNPLSLLQAAFGQGGSYTELLMGVLHRQGDPFTPLQLVCYSDEVTPGNALAASNARKEWIFYFSFLNYGALALSKEESWLPGFIARTDTVANLSGGISQMFVLALKEWFCNENFDVQTAGFTLKHPDNSLWRVTVDLQMILQDGAAHKLVFNLKGDAGTKMCVACKNLISLSTDVVDPESGEVILTSSLTYEHELDKATDEDLKSTVARLLDRKKTLSSHLFAKWEQAVGVCYEPDGLLFCKDLASVLRPISQLAHDPMHALMVSGIFQTVLFLLLSSLKKSSVKIYNLLENYVALWTQPKSKYAKLHSLFAPHREESNKRAGTFKCTGSETLGVYPIIAVFLACVILPQGICTKEISAFLALSDLLDLVMSTAICEVSPEDMKVAVKTFLLRCVEAGWKEAMHPKFHWINHFSDTLSRHLCLINCFVAERKHKVCKRYSTDIRNTVSYEMSVTTQVLCHDLSVLREHGIFDFSVRLCAEQELSAKMKHFIAEQFGFVNLSVCFTSSAAYIKPAGKCIKGDVVLVQNLDGLRQFDAGEVWLHCQVAGTLLTLISMWQLTRYDSKLFFADWQKADNPMWIRTDEILAPTIYTALRNDVVRTLIPLAQR
eukprot:TRINITY_DN109326_c0_g1_i1.p1 TRINITY_DN109326_c0_g1~~TRINITY_DN109326_c0_g1_i1.p1  ORF type:complete len:703 (-),score=112.07 TRINITY_DN109326_c0_g1_i1:23-2131(-)